MMNAATVAAVAGAVGVVAGALVSSVGVVLREQLVGRREREAQQALRQQQLADQRAVFQRDTILDLQQAIGELWSQSADAYNQAALQQAETGEWSRPDLTIITDFNKVSAHINALRARVFDDELRVLTSELLIRIWAGVEVSDWSQQPGHMIAAREPLNRLQKRVNCLLKSLF
jgi:hypothetical protein